MYRLYKLGFSIQCQIPGYIYNVLNINGLRTKRCNKLDLPELKHVFQTNDIVLFTETWSSVYHDLHVDGFECLFCTETKICCHVNGLQVV